MASQKMAVGPTSDPPTTLGEAGSALWCSITAEYRIEDAGGRILLEQACSAADRAKECSDIIAVDGSMISTKHGPKDHPLLRHELAARSFVVRTIARLGLDVEPVRSGPGVRRARSHGKAAKVRTNRILMRRPSRRRLSASQELALWLGEASHKPAFRDEEEARQAWFYHRDRLLAAWGKHGRRPMAWWCFEAGFPWPGYRREQSVLFEAGALAEEEASGLIAWWQEQFERAQRPDFFFCEGPGRFFSGAAARRRHYAWADIPDRLVKEWGAAYRASRHNHA